MRSWIWMGAAAVAVALALPAAGKGKGRDHDWRPQPPPRPPVVCCNADGGDEDEGLEVGGQTIGGPGAFEGIEPGERQFIGGGDLPGACATIVNTSQGSIDIELWDGLDPQRTNIAGPGESGARCEDDPTLVSIFCDESSTEPCAGFWRIDRR